LFFGFGEIPTGSWIFLKTFVAFIKFEGILTVGEKLKRPKCEKENLASFFQTTGELVPT
jgi:hypothetical protein